MKNLNKAKDLTRLIFVSLSLLMIFSGYSFAQSAKGKIAGTIESVNGENLVYATAALKGTSYGSTSDSNGKFTVEAPAGSYTLVVSYTGYLTKEIAVSVKSNQTTEVGIISLEESNELLGEVVVDGMISKFSKKKSDDVARMPLKNLENPQVYTVIPKELFTEQVSVNFRTALMSSPGVANVTLGVGSGGTGLTMYLRGFSGANGAGAIRNGMATNWVSLSDPANLESLEIIKGPSSTLFGSTLVSYGGLVNRVTKKAFNGTAGEVSFSTGGYGLGRVAFDYNTPLNEDKTLLFRVNTAVQREKSFQDYGQNKTIMFAPTFTYLASDRLTFDVDLEYFESHRTTTYVRINSSTPITSLDDLNWNFDKSYTSNEFLSSAKVLNSLVKATYKLSEEWTSETALSYSSTNNDANYLFLLISDPDSLTRRGMNVPSMFNTVQVQQNFVGKFKIGSMQNKLLVGLDYTQLQTTDSRSMSNFDKVGINGENTELDAGGLSQAIIDASPFMRYKRDNKTYSVYASDVINFTDRLVGMASLRLDNYHNAEDDYEQTALSPKFGLIYQLVKNKISLFGNYLNGFKNLAPAYTDPNHTELENLDPEHANQMEAGVKFELLGNKLNGTLSYYNISVDDKVRTVTNDENISYSVQDGTQKSSGIEIDLIANPVKGMHIVFGYGYNDSEYTNISAALDGHRPYSVPEHVGNFWFSHRLTRGNLNGFGFGIGGNFSSDYYLNDANTITVPSFTKFDATLFYDQPKFRIGLKLNNFTNEEYWMSAYDAEPQMPSTFIANMTIRF